MAAARRPQWEADRYRARAQYPRMVHRPTIDVHEALRQSIRGEVPRPLETREALKGIAFADSNPDCDDHFDKNKPCPSGVYGVSDQHVVLDSAQAADVQPEKGTYQFNFALQTAGKERHIGVRDTLDTVIQIRSVKFCVPLPLLADVPAVPPAPLAFVDSPGADDPRGETNPVEGMRSQLAHCPRVVLYFNELGEECYHGFKDRRYHFEYEASIVGITGEPGARMELAPINPLITFTEPKQIQGLTMQFFSPDLPLRMPPDEIRNVLLKITTLGYLQIVAPSHVAGHAVDLSSMLVPGDRIFFNKTTISSDAIVSDEIAVTLSNYLSRDEGLYVAGNGAGAYAPTTATIHTDPLISTGLAPAALHTLTVTTAITMRIAKNRIRAPFVFRKVKEGLTNYIAP